MSLEERLRRHREDVVGGCRIGFLFGCQFMWGDIHLETALNARGCCYRALFYLTLITLLNGSKL